MTSISSISNSSVRRQPGFKAEQTTQSSNNNKVQSTDDSQKRVKKYLIGGGLVLLGTLGLIFHKRIGKFLGVIEKDAKPAGDTIEKSSTSTGTNYSATTSSTADAAKQKKVKNPPVASDLAIFHRQTELSPSELEKEIEAANAEAKAAAEAEVPAAQAANKLGSTVKRIRKTAAQKVHQAVTTTRKRTPRKKSPKVDLKGNPLATTAEQTTIGTIISKGVKLFRDTKNDFGEFFHNRSTEWKYFISTFKSDAFPWIDALRSSGKTAKAEEKIEPAIQKASGARKPSQAKGTNKTQKAAKEPAQTQVPESKSSFTSETAVKSAAVSKPETKSFLSGLGAAIIGRIPTIKTPKFISRFLNAGQVSKTIKTNIETNKVAVEQAEKIFDGQAPDFFTKGLKPVSEPATPAAAAIPAPAKPQVPASGTEGTLGFGDWTPDFMKKTAKGSNPKPAVRTESPVAPTVSKTAAENTAEQAAVPVESLAESVAKPESALSKLGNKISDSFTQYIYNPVAKGLSELSKLDSTKAFMSASATVSVSKQAPAAKVVEEQVSQNGPRKLLSRLIELVKPKGGEVKAVKSEAEQTSGWEVVGRKEYELPGSATSSVPSLPLSSLQDPIVVIPRSQEPGLSFMNHSSARTTEVEAPLALFKSETSHAPAIDGKDPLATLDEGTYHSPDPDDRATFEKLIQGDEASHGPTPISEFDIPAASVPAETEASVIKVIEAQQAEPESVKTIAGGGIRGLLRRLMPGRKANKVETTAQAPMPEVNLTAETKTTQVQRDPFYFLPKEAPQRPIG